MNRGRYIDKGLCEAVGVLRPCPRVATRMFTKEQPKWASTVYVLCDEHADADDEGRLLVGLGGYREEPLA